MMTSHEEKIRKFSAKEAAKLLAHEDFRNKVIQIILDQVDKVTFMNKIREYAGMEIDSRVFRSFNYWSVLVISAIVTSGIGVAIGYLSK